MPLILAMKNAAKSEDSDEESTSGLNPKSEAAALIAEACGVPGKAKTIERALTAFVAACKGGDDDESEDE